MNISDLWNNIYSGHSVIVVETNEEHRFISEVFRTRKKTETTLLTWAPESKIREVKTAEDLYGGCSVDEIQSDEDVARYIQDTLLGAETPDTGKRTVLLLRNLDIMPQGMGFTISSILKNNLRAMKRRYITAVIVTENGAEVSPRIGHDYLYFHYSLMTAEELTTYARQIIESTKALASDPQKSKDKVMVGGKKVEIGTAYHTDYTDEEYSAVGSALGGLTLQEAGQALMDSIRTHGRLELSSILATKKNIVEKTGLLEWHDPADLGNVGGMENLKDWLKIRAMAISNPAARKYGLSAPKGLMLLGPPGTGKSLLCKAIASMWNLPLVRLDIGKVMDRYVGGSEGKLRQALNIIEATSPVVVN